MVLEAYKSDVGAYPTTQQGLQALYERPPDVPLSRWNGPYAKNDIPLDYWQNPYIYHCVAGDHYTLTSTGKDGKEGTDDDDMYTSNSK